MFVYFAVNTTPESRAPVYCGEDRRRDAAKQLAHIHAADGYGCVLGSRLHSVGPPICTIHSPPAQALSLHFKGLFSDLLLFLMNVTPIVERLLATFGPVNRKLMPVNSFVLFSVKDKELRAHQAEGFHPYISPCD